VELRSSSLPREGRCPARSPPPTTRGGGCDPRPSRGRDAASTSTGARGTGRSCDPRPSRGRDAAAGHDRAERKLPRLRSSSLPREGRCPRIRGGIARTSQASVLRSSSLPREGRCLGATGGIAHQRAQLRSSSLPREGRCQYSLPSAVAVYWLRSSSLPREGRCRACHRRAPVGCGCDPRPSRGRDAAVTNS